MMSGLTAYLRVGGRALCLGAGKNQAEFPLGHIQKQVNKNKANII